MQNNVYPWNYFLSFKCLKNVLSDETHIEACSTINRWFNIQGVGDEDILLEDYNSEGEQEDEDEVSFF